MRLGIVPLVVFSVLISLALAGALGPVPTFVLQTGIVLMVIGGTQWVQRARQQSLWRGLSVEQTVEPSLAYEEDHGAPEPASKARLALPSTPASTRA